MTWTNAHYQDKHSLELNIFGTKPFGEAMFTYRWLDLWLQTSVKFENVFKNLYLSATCQFVFENVVGKMAAI